MLGLVHALRLRITGFGLSVVCKSIWQSYSNAQHVVAELQPLAGRRDSRYAVAVAQQATMGPAHTSGTAAAAPGWHKHLVQQIRGQRSSQQAGRAAGWPLPACAAAVQHSITRHLYPAALRAYGAESAVPAAVPRASGGEVDSTAAAKTGAPGSQHKAATPAIKSRRALGKRMRIAAVNISVTVEMEASEQHQAATAAATTPTEGHFRGKAARRAFNKLIWGADTIQQLQINIQQAAPTMTPAQAAVAFTGVAKMLDSSGSSSPPLAVGQAEELTSTVVGIWCRLLATASVEDLCMVLQAWSKLHIPQEHVHLWVSTVSAFLHHPQRHGNISPQQSSRAAYAIAVAGAGIDSAAATGEEAFQMLAVELADLLPGTESTGPGTEHTATIVYSLSKMIAAHETAGWSLPASLLALVQRYQEQLAVYGHEQVHLRVREGQSVQQLAALVSSKGSTFSAANVAAAATRVAQFVQQKREQQQAGAALLDGQLADLWAQRVAAATSEDVRDMLVACGQLYCYDNPVLWGGSLSALLQHMQELQSKHSGQKAQVSEVSLQQQQDKGISHGLQEQSHKEQHEPGQQQVEQPPQKPAAAKLRLQVLRDVLSLMTDCAKQNQGTIPGLSMCATADVLDALGQHVLLRLGLHIFELHWDHPRFNPDKDHWVSGHGASLLMMARAAVGIPPSSRELDKLLGSLADVSQLQPINVKYLARIILAVAKLQRNSTWHPSLDENMWQQLLNPRELEKVASLNPSYVAKTARALCELAITVPLWGAAVDAQPCLSRHVACSAVSQLLAGPVAQDMHGWTKHEVRISSQACHHLGLQNHVFLQRVHAVGERPHVWVDAFRPAMTDSENS